jgi:hypothetical protein
LFCMQIPTGVCCRGLWGSGEISALLSTWIKVGQWTHDRTLSTNTRCQG